MSRNSGFTLIELMIVVAILGMVAAVAIPAYIDYVAKTQASEGVTLISAAKSPLTEYYGSNGSVPSVADINIVDTGKYVDSITIISAGTNVIIQATFKTSGVNIGISGKTIAVSSNESLRDWECGLSGVVSSTYTDIDFKFLPTSCR